MNQKVALITGGSHGIGLEIVKEFLTHEYFVVTCARHSPEEKIDAKLEKNFRFFTCDISNTNEREQLIKKIMDLCGRVDILINNAGVAPEKRMDLLEATEQSFETVLKINLQGPYFLTQKIARIMLDLKNSKKISKFTPAIINISSMSAYTSSTFRGEYCISKAGISMMTKLFADRLSSENICVYEIQPGVIETPMTAPSKERYNKLIQDGTFPLKRWGQPQDVAIAALSLAEGKIPYSTGQILNIDGGFHLRRL